MGAVADGRPDPSCAGTPAEFIAQLNQLRAWAGRPSFRSLRGLAGVRPGSGDPPQEALPTSTTHEILAGRRLPKLPRLDFVEAYVAACLRAGRCSPEEIEAEVTRWRDSWRALTQADLDSGNGAGQVSTVEIEPSRDQGEWMLGRLWAARRRLVLAVMAVALFAVGTATGRFLPGGPASPETPTAAPGRRGSTFAELIVNGTFDPPVDPWWRHGKPVVLAAGHARVEVTGGAVKPWDDALGQSSIFLRKGRTYTLGFDAWADSERVFRVLVQTETPPRQTPFNEPVPVTTARRPFAFRFVSPLTAGDGQILFHFGGPQSAGYTVHLDNVSLVEHPG
jgi:hypothetical protein